MTDTDLHERLRAVERALTDADTAVADLSESAAVHERLDALVNDVEELTERLDALDATVQSLHGYVGELEHVNDRVERRADAARAAVERLDEATLECDTTIADEKAGNATTDDSGSARSNTTEPHSRTTSSRSDRAPQGSTTTQPSPDTHSLLDAADDGPTADDESDEESLLDRVRDSL